MRTVRQFIVTAMLVVLGPLSGAGQTEKGLPLYDGRPGTKIGDVCVNRKDGAEMVWVPAGEFLMGSTEENLIAMVPMGSDWTGSRKRSVNKRILERYGDERPQRKVDLDGYWIYRYEVTVAQYRKFCAATNLEMPKAPDWGWKDNHPMVMVSWQDAVEYATWAGVSLPTEAQWEKASRGPDGRMAPWGNQWNPSKCANSVVRKLTSTQPVGSYPEGVSPYGALDMSGNVYEWCADWYDPDYYRSGPLKNPAGPPTAVKFKRYGGTVRGGRVFRGGAWFVDTQDVFRCPSRRDYDPELRDAGRGFRCTADPGPVGRID